MITSEILDAAIARVTGGKRPAQMPCFDYHERPTEHRCSACGAGCVRVFTGATYTTPRGHRVFVWRCGECGWVGGKHEIQGRYPGHGAGRIPSWPTGDEVWWVTE
jgi:hypothetical protein